MTDNNDDKIVFPSEKIAVEEEYLPSGGSYAENGEIKGSVFGKVYINKERYRANVIPFQSRKLKAGRFDTVIGTIIRVSKSSVRLEINYLNKKPTIPSMSAIMHISDASREYVTSLDDLFASGDVIRANVIDAKTIPLQLECKKNNTGVIHSLCEICGDEVKKIKRDLLKCESCDRVQRRKTAFDYGNLAIAVEY